MDIFLLSVTDNLQKDLKVSLKEEIAKRGNTVAYISSEPQSGDRPYYLSTIDDYSQISSDIKVDYFDLSEDFSDDALTNILDYGTIYLSGGNTYVFMDSARKRNLYPILKKHLSNNGLLIGASAGSIMMTPSISLAGFEDENIPNLKDTTGFNFVDFEFHPHFNNIDYAFEHMRNKDNDLYVCKDGEGMFYSNGEVKLFGEVSKWNGEGLI